MADPRPVRGIATPMEEIIMREIAGVPVVIRYRPLGPIWAHRQWRRFGGQT